MSRGTPKYCLNSRYKSKQVGHSIGYRKYRLVFGVLRDIPACESNAPSYAIGRVVVVISQEDNRVN